MAPPEKVVVVDHVPERCTCGETLRPEDEVDAPSLRQIWELPEVQAIVTQHQLHRRRCGKCKRVNTAEPPPDVPTGQQFQFCFGIRCKRALALSIILA
jgi:zinc-finger binding domain of transposase IS66